MHDGRVKLSEWTADAGITAYIGRRAGTNHMKLQAGKGILIQIAISQVLQLFQSNSQVFAVPSSLSKKCALQHALRIVDFPFNGAPRLHFRRWFRGFACAPPGLFGSQRT